MPDTEADKPDAEPARTEATESDAAPARRPHAMLRYTTLRIALFVIALLLLWLIPHRNVVVVFVGALLISGLASYVLLAGQRAAMAEQLQRARAQRRDRARARAAREDDDGADTSGSPHLPGLPDLDGSKP